MSKKTGNRRIPRWIPGVAVMLLSVCVTFGLLETGFRIVNFQPRGRAAVPFEFQISEIPGIPYELTPDHNYYWTYGARHILDGGFTVPVTINSNGYRDDEITDPKPVDEFRVLAIGDSFTWGLGVAVEDTWVEKLEGLLNTNLSGHRFEVINTGVGSWNTEIEYAYLMNKGMTHQPDAVIVGFLSNDFRSNNTDYLIDNDGFLVSAVKAGSKKLHLQSLVFDNLREKSVIKRFIEGSHVIRWASGRRLRTESQTLHVFNDRNSKEKTRAALQGIVQITRAAGIPLYVSIFPYIEEPVPESEINDLKEVAQWCEAMNVPYADMGEALTGLHARELWVHPKDHHPNAIAHARYAEQMLRAFFISKN